MPKKPTDYGPVVDSHIKASAQLGKTATQTHRELTDLGFEIHLKQVERKLNALRGQTKPRMPAAPSQATARPAPLPEGPAELPADVAGPASPPGLPGPPLSPVFDGLNPDAWLDVLKDEATKAKGRGDMPSFAAMSRLILAIFEHKRKAAPPPADDPNENPDIVAYGAQVEERLLKLLNDWKPAA